MNNKSKLNAVFWLLLIPSISLSFEDLKAQSKWQTIHSGGKKWTRVNGISLGLGTFDFETGLWRATLLDIHGSLFRSINRIGFGIGLFEVLASQKWENGSDPFGFGPVSTSFVLLSRRKGYTYEEFYDSPSTSGIEKTRTFTGGNVEDDVISPMVFVEARGSAWGIFGNKYLDLSLRSMLTLPAFEPDDWNPIQFYTFIISAGVVFRSSSNPNLKGPIDSPQFYISLEIGGIFVTDSGFW